MYHSVLVGIIDTLIHCGMRDMIEGLTERAATNAFHVVDDLKTAFGILGLTHMAAVFAFEGDHNLTKKRLAGYRTRLRFQTEKPSRTFFLKRYEHPPMGVQLLNWLDGHRRRSCSMTELQALVELSRHGIGVPRPVAYGQTWGAWFERRSFLVTEEIADAQSLERQLPSCFYRPDTSDTRRQRRRFIRQLAAFLRKFHNLGYRHRDLYLAHVFRDTEGRLFLIDLARAFKPLLWRRRFLVKDLAQIYYSMPARYFTRSDRLRFCLSYCDTERLAGQARTLMRRIMAKAKRMARHNIKHGAAVPFLTTHDSSRS